MTTNIRRFFARSPANNLLAIQNSLKIRPVLTLWLSVRTFGSQRWLFSAGDIRRLIFSWGYIDAENHLRNM